MNYSRGFHPLPKIRFAAALPVGVESLHESVDIDLLGNMAAHTLSSRMNAQLPKGIDIAGAQEIGVYDGAANIIESHYEIFLNGLRLKAESLNNFLASESFPISKRGKKGIQIVDARPLVRNMILSEEKKLQFVVRHEKGPLLKPTDIVKAVFDLTDSDMDELRIMKIRQVLRA
jgi:radical SAM-linked protein